jgi:hypothetical protein
MSNDTTTDRIDEVIGILATGVRRLFEQRAAAPRGEGAQVEEDAGDPVRLALSGDQRPHADVVDTPEQGRR